MGYASPLASGIRTDAVRAEETDAGAGCLLFDLRVFNVNALSTAELRLPQANASVFV